MAARVVEPLPYRYEPACLSNCDLGRHCRSCATAADDPARFGGDTANLLGGMDTAARALELADGAGVDADTAETADLLLAYAQNLIDSLLSTFPGLGCR